MNIYVNMVLVAAFLILSVILLIRWSKVNRKVMISDQQWSVMRMVFLGIGLLAIFQIMSNTAKSGWDVARMVSTIVLVTVYLILKDGVGEEGLVSSGKFYPWSEVRSYDWEDRKKIVAVYFTVESQDEKKPDQYRTKELDFSQEDREYLMRFLEINCRRKFTRMKKKKK